MSDLSDFLDHARLMADGGPPAPTRRTLQCSWSEAHDECTGDGRSCACDCHAGSRPVPPTAEQRDLWRRLADEIDAYLTGPAQEETLWTDT